jgi:hypothetical protein
VENQTVQIAAIPRYASDSKVAASAAVAQPLPVSASRGLFNVSGAERRADGQRTEVSGRPKGLLNHVSVIVYGIPASRVTDLLPHGLSLRTTILAGVETAWLSVLSFQDRGQVASGGIAGSFECTSYRLHVDQGGKPAHFLLGISVGSLSAVGAKNLWQMPWHLGAMELQASQDRGNGRYTDYRLHTQSQWDNASWNLSGASDASDGLKGSASGVPTEIFTSPSTSVYKRSDGTLGQAEISVGDIVMTKGRLRSGHSEYLTRHGLLTDEEMQRPALVMVQAKSAVANQPEVLTNRFLPVSSIPVTTGRRI